MSKGRHLFREAEIRRAVKAVESAGMKVGRVEIDKGGTIAVIAANGAPSLEIAPEKVAEIVL
jgi:hypothetical protein